MIGRMKSGFGGRYGILPQRSSKYRPQSSSNQQAEQGPTGDVQWKMHPYPDLRPADEACPKRSDQQADAAPSVVQNEPEGPCQGKVIAGMGGNETVPAAARDQNSSIGRRFRKSARPNTHHPRFDQRCRALIAQDDGQHQDPYDFPCMGYGSVPHPRQYCQIHRNPCQGISGIDCDLVQPSRQVCLVDGRKKTLIPCSGLQQPTVTMTKPQSDGIS